MIHRDCTPMCPTARADIRREYRIRRMGLTRHANDDIPAPQGIIMVFDLGHDRVFLYRAPTRVVRAVIHLTAFAHGAEDFDATRTGFLGDAGDIPPPPFYGIKCRSSLCGNICRSGRFCGYSGGRRCGRRRCGRRRRPIIPGGLAIDLDLSVTYVLHTAIAKVRIGLHRHAWKIRHEGKIQKVAVDAP